MAFGFFLAFSDRSFSNFFFILLTEPFTLFLTLLYSCLIARSLLLATFLDSVFFLLIKSLVFLSIGKVFLLLPFMLVDFFWGMNLCSRSFKVVKQIVQFVSMLLVSLSLSCHLIFVIS